MKTFFRQHKIALFAILGVLCFGILTGLVIAGTIRLSMTEHAFTTVAETKSQEHAAQPTAGTQTEPVLTPKPTNGLSLSAQEISEIARNVQDRRNHAIPIRTNIWEEDNRFLWTESEPSAAQADAARTATEEITKLLYDAPYEEIGLCSISQARVRLLTDPTGDREAFLRVSDPQENYLVFLRASDQALICVDLLAYPRTTSVAREEDALKIAERLGYEGVHTSWHDSRMDASRESVFLCTADAGEYFLIAFCGDTLWQVAIYPSEEAMLECEYFLADIQFDYPPVPAFPERFVETDPPKLGVDEMVTEWQLTNKLNRLHLKLTGEQLDVKKLNVRFYRDESGTREDCWKVEGEGLDVVVSAYSRNVISFTAHIPCKDLVDIPYEGMGGREYDAVTEEIARILITSFGVYEGDTGDARGKQVRQISCNAVADGHVCTMDILLTDGTWYECYFYDGVLDEISCYADDGMFNSGHSGWVADAANINAATGKAFIPQYRRWDGDFHVSPAPTQE